MTNVIKMNAVVDVLITCSVAACLLAFLLRPSVLTVVALVASLAALLVDVFLNQRGVDFREDMAVLSVRLEQAEADARKAKELAASAFESKRKPGF